MERLTPYLDQFWTSATLYVPRILLALITLWVGFKIIGAIVRMIEKQMGKREIDASLIPFIGSLVGWTLKILVIISAASIIGIETTSFVAVIGAAGLAIGLALQGTLANFAGGVLIMIFKPFKVGDLIEGQDQLGTVQEIQIFTTKLASPDSKQIIIPNGILSNGNITNYTTLGKIRVELSIGVSYSTDLESSRSILMDVMNDNDKVFQFPVPFVGVKELADSSINLAVHAHCRPENYWDVYFGLMEDCKVALDKGGVIIPFPQLDLNIEGNDAKKLMV